MLISEENGNLNIAKWDILNGYVTPYLPRYHPNKKAKLNTSFAFCFLCFCYQNFFFLHSHKLRMTNSTLTPMTAG